MKRGVHYPVLIVVAVICSVGLSPTPDALTMLARGSFGVACALGLGFLVARFFRTSNRKTAVIVGAVVGIVGSAVGEVGLRVFLDVAW